MVTQIRIYCFGTLDLIYIQKWIDLQHIDFVNYITIDEDGIWCMEDKRICFNLAVACYYFER